MDNDAALRQLVQSIALGVALVDRETWTVRLENAKFFQWFPPVEDGEEPLSQRMTDLNLDRAATRLSENRPYNFECETKVGARTIPLGIDIRPLSDEADSILIVECHDISKQKQAEFMLSSYSEISEKNARALQKEKERVEKLLLNIMPRTVYEEMKDFGTTTPQRFDETSVLMLDFVGFTEMAISRDPGALVAELNDIFSAFDRIVELFGCERIKTIGDAYLAVSGLPDPNPEHAENIAKVALRMRRYIQRRNASHPTQWHCRIGLATGPVVGSMVGIQKYVYDIFGPAVNLAARLESMAEPTQIVMCEKTHGLIGQGFMTTELGEVDIKGFDGQVLYILEDERM